MFYFPVFTAVSCTSSACVLSVMSNYLCSPLLPVLIFCFLVIFWRFCSSCHCFPPVITSMCFTWVLLSVQTSCVQSSPPYSCIEVFVLPSFSVGLLCVYLVPKFVHSLCLDQILVSWLWSILDVVVFVTKLDCFWFWPTPVTPVSLPLPF